MNSQITQGEQGLEGASARKTGKAAGKVTGRGAAGGSSEDSRGQHLSEEVLLEFKS